MHEPRRGARRPVQACQKTTWDATVIHTPDDIGNYDALLAVRPLFNVIEGVVGRDGTGFRHGKDALADLVIAASTPYTWAWLPVT